MSDAVTNVVIAGLGGQGVLTGSDILAAAAFHASLDVKKSEIHGMSQRGGSVTSDVRFGRGVSSPMVPGHGADFLVLVSADQLEPAKHLLAESGTVICPDDVDVDSLPNARSLNVALLGALSAKLEIPTASWLNAIAEILPPELHEANIAAFTIGAGG